MKILLLSVHPPQGGGSAHSSQELAWGLRSLGHKVIYLAPYRSETDRAHDPDLVWFAADFPDSLQITPAAQEVMDCQVQQVYEQHGKFDWVILGRESFLWQVPAIRAVHWGAIAVIIRGAYINKLAGVEVVEPELRENLLNLYRSCDRLICIAQHLAISVRQVVGDVPITFLPNPIDLSDCLAIVATVAVIAPHRPSSGERIQILMAAQLKPRKRPLDAVEIMHLLVAKGVDCYLNICGEGTDRAEILQRIHDYGLESRISLKGKLERREVMQHLQATDIVLLCSDNEGRPRVLQEAIAAKKAIVAYDNPGSREIITSWLNNPWELGRLVAIGDIEAARDAILELAPLLQQNPELAPEIPSSQQILAQYEALLQAEITAV